MTTLIEELELLLRDVEGDIEIASRVFSGIDTATLESTAAQIRVDIETSKSKLLTAIIPDPDYIGGNSRTEIYGSDVEEMTRNVRTHIDDNGYGASDIGSIFNVYGEGVQIGTVRYNGRFDYSGDGI